MSLLDTEKQFHLNIDKNDVGKYAILTGDPKRVKTIAENLDDAYFVADRREFVTYTGYLNGEKVSVTSTGIGGPSAAIAVEELVKCGCHTFIRVGTSGGIDLSVCGGDLVIPTAAIRGDGTSYEYLPKDYPAAADFSVVEALKMSADKICTGSEGNAYHIGVIQSKDSFYGETNPETMPVSDFLEKRWEAYRKCGCLTSEMECASIFSVAIARSVRAGAVITAIWNVERSKNGLKDTVCNDSTRAIQCAVDAMKILIDGDRKNCTGGGKNA